jgi:hypothetical protein
MEVGRRTVLQGTAAAGLLAALGLSGCTRDRSSPASTQSTASPGTYSLSLDHSAWH